MKKLIDSLFIDTTQAQEKLSHLVADCHFFESITSTNDYLLSCVKQKQLTTKTLVLSKHQVAGKGTHRKAWLDNSDALLFSILIPISINQLESISLWCGYAIAEILNQFGFKVQLKWPNDLWYKNGKVGGILCELVKNPEKQSFLVIGIGINLTQPPIESSQTYLTTGLKPTWLPSERTELLVSLVQNLFKWIYFDENTPKPEIKKLWEKYDLLDYDEQIDLIFHHKKAETAKYKGIGDKGELIVEINQQLESLSSVQVSLRKQS